MINIFSTPISHERFELASIPKFEKGWEAEWSNCAFLPELKNFVDAQVNKYFRACGFTDITLSEYHVWINSLEGSGQHIIPHSHGTALVGWVYYVDIPENSGDIVFLNPKGNNSWDYFYRVEDSRAPAEHDLLYKFKPKNGDLLIFPGWILHYVEPNNSDQLRISMAGEYHSQDLVKSFNYTHKYDTD
jgi:uncharacterized protein (TIGR02466 family)